MAHSKDMPHTPSDPATSPELADSLAHGYERHDIGLRGIFNFLIGLILTMVLVLLLIYGVLELFVEHDRQSDPIASPIVVEHGPVPEPLQPSISHDLIDWQDMQAMREQTQKILSSSGVTSTGRRHIPITQAMDLVLPMLPIHPSGGAQQ
jgi:hypothetical protein